MPDVTVELLTSSIAQLQNRGLELGNLPRNGQVVEARVIALLKDGMARLALLGQTLDVSAPSTLQPGTSISVAVIRDGANLKLVMQQDAQAAPQQAPVASAPALKADPAAFLPATVKAAIIGALLDSLNTGTPSAERTGSPPQSPPAPATAATARHPCRPAGRSLASARSWASSDRPDAARCWHGVPGARPCQRSAASFRVCVFQRTLQHPYGTATGGLAQRRPQRGHSEFSPRDAGSAPASATGSATYAPG